MDKGALPKGGKYLRCSNAILTRKCNASAMRYDDVEHLLLALVREVDFSTAVNGYEWQANLTKLKVEKLENQKAIQTIDKRIARIVDAIADLPGSAALREKLAALEIEKETVAKSIRKIEAEIAEHSMTSAPDREALLLRLNDAELNADEQVRQRKKVNAEIRRFIRSIKLRPTPALAWEDNAASSQSIVADPVEVDIGYRNGNWQYYSPIDRIDMFGQQSERLKKLKAKVKIESLD